MMIIITVIIIIIIIIARAITVCCLAVGRSSTRIEYYSMILVCRYALGKLCISALTVDDDAGLTEK